LPKKKQSQAFSNYKLFSVKSPFDQQYNE